jgi:predicted glycosyltransferase
MSESALLNRKLEIFEHMYKMAKELNLNMGAEDNDKYIAYIERKKTLIKEARKIDSQLAITIRDPGNRRIAAKISETAGNIIKHDTTLREKADIMLGNVKNEIKQARNMSKLSRGYNKNALTYMFGSRDLFR